MGEDTAEYSFHCKHCGFTQFSGDKEYIKYVRNTHRLKMYQGVKYKYCDMVQTEKGKALYSRADLAEKIIAMQN